MREVVQSEGRTILDATYPRDPLVSHSQMGADGYRPISQDSPLGSQRWDHNCAKVIGGILLDDGERRGKGVVDFAVI